MSAPPAVKEIFAQFQNTEGANVGPPLSIPLSTTQAQLDALINQILSKDEILPYSFFVDDVEIINSLERDISVDRAASGKGTVSSESVINIKFAPQAIFRVHPVSRCSSTLPGIQPCQAACPC